MHSNTKLQGIFRLCIIVLLSIGTCLVILDYTVFGQYRTLLVSIREVLVTDFTTDQTLLQIEPERLYQQGFLSDPPEVRARWNAQLHQVSYIGNKLDQIAQTNDDTQKAQQLVRLFSIGGDRYGCGGIDELLAKLEALQRGYGCCSDHTEAFLALAAVAGLQAREMQTSVHSVNEFYDHQLHKWLYIDPMYARMAKDEQGRYLSLMELRQHYFERRPVIYVFFGRFEHLFVFQEIPNKGPFVWVRLRWLYDEPQDFIQLVMVNGNNVLQQADSTQALIRIPKPLRQPLEYVRGIRPMNVSIADSYSNAAVQKTQLGKLTLFLIAGVLGAGILFYPAHSMSKRCAAIQLSRSHTKVATIQQEKKRR